MAGNRLVRIAALLLFISFPGWAQENRYMVFFKDTYKAGLSHVGVAKIVKRANS